MELSKYIELEDVMDYLFVAIYDDKELIDDIRLDYELTYKSVDRLKKFLIENDININEILDEITLSCLRAVGTDNYGITRIVI